MNAEVNDGLEKNEEKENALYTAITAFCGAKAATSMQRTAWMHEEWQDRDTDGFCETDFIQNFRLMRATFETMFVFVCDSHLCTIMTKVDLE